jgi:hypothetical protein
MICLCVTVTSPSHVLYLKFSKMKHVGVGKGPRVPGKLILELMPSYRYATSIYADRTIALPNVVRRIA